MLIVEMKGMADCFAKMTESCYSKCIPNVHESKLSVGEMSCVDRCVSKYMDVHAAVGSELQGAMATDGVASQGGRPLGCVRGGSFKRMGRNSPTCIQICESCRVHLSSLVVGPQQEDGV